MKKALLVLVFGMMMGLVGYGQNTFIRMYNTGPNAETFEDVTVISNGNYVAVGNSRVSPFTNNLTIMNVVIYSPTGQLLHEWSNTTPSTKKIFTVAPTLNGGFVVAGMADTNTIGLSAMMMAFNEQGDSLWNRNFHVSNDTLCRVSKMTIIQRPDSGYTILGSFLSINENGIAILKTDKQGNLTWNYIRSGLTTERPTDVTMTNDNGYLISGRLITAPNPDSLFCLKIDSLGSELWYRTYRNNGLGLNGSYVTRGSSGDFLITVYYYDSTGTVSPSLFKINANGDSLTTRNLNANKGILSVTPALNGGYLITGYTKAMPSWFSGDIIAQKVDSNLNDEWDNVIKTSSNPFQSHSWGTAIHQLLNKGILISGSWNTNACLLKLDSLGNIPKTIVKGKVINDLNADCSFDTLENPLPNYTIKLESNSINYGYTNTDGVYSIEIYDTGQAILSWFPPNTYWMSSACQSNGLMVSLPYKDTLNLDIFAIPQINCPYLTVSLNTPFLRRCFQSKYTVNYCNNGTLPANSAYIEIEMDPYLTVDSASIPWLLPQQGNLYRFNVDTVGIGQCGSFNIWVTVDCDSTELGQTHCVSAHIYPDSICLPQDPAWDGSSVAVSGFCDVGDTLDLKIQNVGASDMTSPSFFLIAEDNVMYNSGNFQLQAGDSLKFRFKGNGSTFTLLADQVEGHPGTSFPMVSIEGCGVNNQGTFSKGFVTQYPQDDQNGYVDVLCLQNIGAYDPNDKRPEPLGLDNEGYITATQPLDYTIRFQNTGTDTAFTVIIRDTLSPYLDITTLYLTGASHPYSFQIIGSNVLEWTFANILLPDSNVNEPLSHGFVSFHIDQVDGNAVGTEIRNRAGIYFDFNAVVLTNTTLNTIIADYKTWFTFVQSPEGSLQLGIYPNPNNGTFSLDISAKPTASYEFAIYDLAGAKQFGQTLTGNAPYILQPDLPTGMYIYQLLENGTAVGMGKVVVNK